MMGTKPYQQFIEDTFHKAIPYQNESDEAYYFVEIPFLNVEKLNQFAAETGIALEVMYQSRLQIMSENESFADKKLKSLFTDDFTAFVQKYIESQEPIPTLGRYGVLVIYTTPTNYRILGILGSLFKKFGEEWKVYKYPLEEPDEEEMSQWNGKKISSYILNF